MSPAQQEQLAKLEAASYHLLDVINAILDLSKIEAGSLTLEEAPVCVATLLDNVAAMLHDRAAAKNLKLCIEHGELPPRLRGDPTRLQQALLNYATNAVKFTERGTITLRANIAEESGDAGRAPLGSQRYRHRHSARGVRASCSAPLPRPTARTTRKYGGTGLGLAINRKLAELMGGEAGLSSTPGVGSTFWLTARLAKERPRPAGRRHGPRRIGREPAPAALRRGRILLAEDEPVNREVAEMLLDDVDLQVDAAADGVEALARCVKRAITP